jgi:Raf kinase inhibitor-like YbhB/YbcL family protein
VSLVLTLHDPDVPKVLKPDGVFDHWVMYSIPVQPGVNSVEFAEGKPIGVFGLNGAGKESYVGPCPPTEYEPTEHRYFFTLYALSTELSFLAPPTKKEVEAALQGYVIESVELVGRYDRKK